MKSILVLIFFSLGALACPKDHSAIELMMKAPKLKSRPVVESSFTENDFLNLIARVRKIYDPILLARGLESRYLLYWNVDEGNAVTSQNDGVAYFAYSGGLLRGKHMTRDGFLFAACHEIGHHLGGFPKDPTLPWASAEGQSDYFATLSCLKEIFRGDPENAQALEQSLPKSVERQCRRAHADEDGYLICLRSTKAGEDAFRFLQARERGKDADESLFGKILFPVGETIMRYPSHSCRALTGLQGALCLRREELSDTDETMGFCHEKNDDQTGERPRCWFKPGAI